MAGTARVAPLLGERMGWWQTGERQRVLALDATSLRQTVTLLAGWQLAETDAWLIVTE